jgi:hypothetical protein
MFWTKTILVLGLTALFAQSGDMPPVPVAGGFNLVSAL